MKTILSVTSWMDNENMAYSAIKEGNSAICDSMDEITVIILSKISQAEKDKYSFISVVCGIWGEKLSS